MREGSGVGGQGLVGGGRELGFMRWGRAFAVTGRRVRESRETPLERRLARVL